MADTKKLWIQGDPIATREIIALLKDHDSSNINILPSDKNISGPEVITMIVELTTIVANVLTIWLVARPYLKNKIKIEDLSNKEDK